MIVKTMNKKKKVLALIDGNALVHRAYHALPFLTTKDGRPSGAVYGFALTLFSMMEKVKPDYIIASFDVKGPTFRHKEFKEYKANRKKAPDDLYEQIPLAQKMLRAYGIPIYTKKGYEADDVLGTISKNPEIEKKLDTLIVTGDMDLAQLVDKDTSIFTLRRGVKDTAIYDEKAVEEKFHLKPEQIVDYKALRGDPSDNIPGVKGIGEKTAVALLQKFGSLKNIYKNLDKIDKPAVKKKLLEHKKEAFLSYSLAKIKTDVPIDDLDLGKAKVENLNKNGLGKFFQEMGFESLYKRLFSDKNGYLNSSLTGAMKKMKKKFEFQEISSEMEWQKLLAKIKRKKEFSYFLATDTEKFYSARPLGLGMFAGGQKTYFLKSDLIKQGKDLFQSGGIKKYVFDGKLFLELVDYQFGFDLQKTARKQFDIFLVSFLLGKISKVKLEKLIFLEFGATFQNDLPAKRQSDLWGELSLEEKKLVAEKAGWVGRLASLYRKRLQAKEYKKIAKLFSKIEQPLTKVLAKMELNGIKVDKGVLDKLSVFLDKKLSVLEKKIYQLAGEEFNINSPAQLAKVLFEKLKLPTTDIKRTKEGYSTDAEQLARLRGKHKIIKYIERFREYAKLKNTYADPLPRLVQKDGRIHTTFNQMGTATGRLSSTNPNLQNIPKYGRVAHLIRKAFVAEEGKVLLSADYSQFDLRVAAHLSGDQRMIKVFRENGDIHRSTAAWVNKVKPEEVTEEQRREAKSLNFGMLYGMGVYGFMRDSGVSKERAEFFMEEYKKNFPKLVNFLERIKEEVKKKGYAETELGRRRYFPNINSDNGRLRAAEERAAINFPMQGLTADIMKMAMVKIGKELLPKFPTAKLELQIHDELIVEVAETEAEKFGQKIKRLMEGVYKLKVPLVVDVSQGKNWSEL